MPRVDAASWQGLVDRFKTIVARRTGRRVSAGRPRAAARGDRGGLRLVELQTRHRLPPVQQNPRRLGHRRQRDGDGLRQHGRRLGNRRRLYARSQHRRARALRRVSAATRRARTSSPASARPRRLPIWRSRQPKIYAQFEEIATRLERHYRDVQDLEFTVERGKLFMLQTRSAKRTAEAAVKIALDLVGEGLIDKRRAVGMVNAQSLDQLFHARIDPNESARRCVQRAERVARRGGRPDRLHGRRRRRVERARAQNHPRADRNDARRRPRHDRGRRNPHRERRRDVARGRRRARHGQTVRRRLRCACGSIAATKRASLDGKELSEGDWITIDGTTGNVAVGELRLIRPPSKLPEWLATFLSWADELRRMQVWANADTPGGRRKGARARRARHRTLPHRAHVHAARAAADRAPDDSGLDAGRSARRRSNACCRFSAKISAASSARWRACRSRSGCSIRRCTSSCRRSSSCWSKRPSCA